MNQELDKTKDNNRSLLQSVTSKRRKDNEKAIAWFELMSLKHPEHARRLSKSIDRIQRENELMNIGDGQTNLWLIQQANSILKN